MASAVLGLLLCGYVGAYYWLVRPFRIFGTHAWAVYRTTSSSNTNLPVDRLFVPIHLVDRQLRPHIWDR
jgi:hypothetical protein